MAITITARKRIQGHMQRPEPSALGSDLRPSQVLPEARALRRAPGGFGKEAPSSKKRKSEDSDSVATAFMKPG